MNAYRIIHQLADNEPKIRKMAMGKLIKYLTKRQEPFTQIELLQLWKGLFFGTQCNCNLTL